MVARALFSIQTNEWATPQYVFDALHAEFRFTLDAAANDANAKLPRYFTSAQDGLRQSWVGERVFCNPPYGRTLAAWVEKMANSKAEICVGLIPARTDTRYFHEWIYHRAEIRFLCGRLKFSDAKYNAPFPSMVCIW